MFETFLGGQAVTSRTLDRFARASEGLSGSDIRQICDGARRAAVVQGLTDVPEAEILRRLLLRTIDSEGLPVHQLIAKAKERLPDVFTHRVLAEAFHMSPGNVTHILKKLKVEGDA
jgi:hypothetical protein